MLAERRAQGPSGSRDTLQALIAARIDRLPPTQRTLIQRAAAMGRLFMRGALVHLSPAIVSVDAALEGLVLRDLVVREARATISGEQAFKFKHVLIREVAYSGLSKSARAEHHADFAEWLAERAGGELLEIRAFHLDQAARCTRSSTALPRRRPPRRRRTRSHVRAGARCRVRPSAARGSSCCGPSSSSPPSTAATSRLAQRGGSRT